MKSLSYMQKTVVRAQVLANNSKGDMRVYSLQSLPQTARDFLEKTQSQEQKEVAENPVFRGRTWLDIMVTNYINDIQERIEKKK